MKKIIFSTAIATVLISATCGRAQSFLQNIYFNSDAGAIFQQSSEALQTLGNGHAMVTYNPGVRVDFGLGYNFNRMLSAGIETGIMWNSMDEYGGVPISNFGQSADFYSVPLLAIVTFKIPTKSHFVPYVSAGAGGNVSVLALDTNGTRQSASDIEPAIQGEAGLKYAINPNVSLGISYKFMATLDQHYSFPGIDLEQRGIYIHGVFVNFTLSF